MLREVTKFIAVTIVYIGDLAMTDRTPPATSFCCDEVLQGAGRCSHTKHTLVRANEAGTLWVCLCDPWRAQ